MQLRLPCYRYVKFSKERVCRRKAEGTQFVHIADLNYGFFEPGTILTVL